MLIKLELTSRMKGDLAKSVVYRGAAKLGVIWDQSPDFTTGSLFWWWRIGQKPHNKIICEKICGGEAKSLRYFFIQKYYLFSLFQTFLWCFIHLWWCFPPIPLNVKILEQNTDCFLATFLCCPMFSPNNISHSECQPPNKNATTLWLRIFTPQTKCVNITHLKSQQIFL